MSVDGSEISKFQRFKQVTAFAYKTLNAMFNLTRNLTTEMSAHRQFTQCLPDIILKFIISLGSRYIRQVFFQSAYIGINAHAIIIQNDQEIGISNAGMIHSFKSQSGS